MGPTIPKSNADGKAHDLPYATYAFGPIDHEAIQRCRTTGVGMVTSDTVGFPRASVWGNYEVDYDEEGRFENFLLHAPTVRRYDERGRYAGDELHLDVIPDPAPGEMGPVSNKIPESQISFAEELITGVCIEDLEIAHEYYADALVFRERIRERWRPEDDFRDQIAWLKQVVWDYFDEVYGEAPHPAVVLFTSQMLALQLFQMEPHPDVRVEGRGPVRPLGYSKCIQHVPAKLSIKSLEVVDHSPTRQVIGNIRLTADDGRPIALLVPKRRVGASDAKYAAYIDFYRMVTSDAAKAAWEATQGAWAEREEQFEGWTEAQILTAMRERGEPYRARPSRTLLALATVAFHFYRKGSFPDDGPELPITIEKLFGDDKASAARFTALVLMKAPGLLGEEHKDENGAPLDHVVKALRSVVEDMSDEEILAGLRRRGQKSTDDDQQATTQQEDAKDQRTGCKRKEIMLTGRHTRDIVEDGLTVLLQGDFYRRVDRVARVASLANGITSIEQLSDEWLRGFIHEHANIVRVTKDGELKWASIPLAIIKEARSYGLDRFRLIIGMTASPLRSDGTLASRGYDSTTQLYHIVPELRPIPENPTPHEVRAASALLCEVFDEFAFDDAASRANTIAALITIAGRTMIHGGTPLFTVNARKSGNGKTYLVEVLAMAALGIRIGATSLTTHEEERRKLLLSQLLSSPPVILLDNVVGTLHSPALASAITAGVVTDRILGRSEVISVPNTSVFFLNGNNLAITGELARRRVPIMLDAKLARPELRKFTRPDLLPWVEEHRAEILHGVCVLIRAWIAAGRPKADHPRPASFGRWAELVGGVLAHAGIEGFLNNLRQTNPDDDLESAEWENLLTFLHSRTDGEPFTASFVHELVTDGGALRKHDIVELLPIDLADMLAKFPQTFSKRLGTAFRDRHRTRFGLYRLERAGEDRNKRTLWKIVKDA